MYKIKKSRVCCYKSEKTVHGKYTALMPTKGRDGKVKT